MSCQWADMYKHSHFRMLKYPLVGNRGCKLVGIGDGSGYLPKRGPMSPFFEDPRKGNLHDCGESEAAQVKGTEGPHLHTSYSCS